MFVLLHTNCMKLRKLADTQTGKWSQRYKGYALYIYTKVFLSCFRERFGSLEPEKIIIRSLESENQVPRIREIGSLQVDTRYLTLFLKKTAYTV